MRIAKLTVVVIGAAVACGCKRIPKIEDRESEEEKEVRLAAPAAEVVGCAMAWRPLADAGPPATGRAVPADGSGSGGAVGVTPGPRPSRRALETTVRFETPTVVGGLDAAAVRRVVRRNAAALERCYQQQLRRKPALAGTVNVEFTIDAAGAVQAARATGIDGDLDACVAATVKQLAFPKPRSGGAQVRYPITFRMASDPGVVHPTDDPAADPGVVHPADPGVVHPGGGVLADLRWADDGADAATSTWAETTVREAVGSLVERIGGCAGDAAGSARARLAIDGDGKVIDLEVMGLGSASAEACIKDQLSSLTIAPPPSPAAVACDLVLGGAPLAWRVTVLDDQPVIEVDENAAVLGGVRQPTTDASFAALRAAVAARRGTDPTAVFLIRASAHASAGTLQRVVETLRQPDVPYVLGVVDAGGSLIRVSDTVPRGLPPPGEPRPRITIALTATRLVATGADGRELVADPGDPVSVRSVIEAAASCDDCSRTVDLQLAPELQARQVLDVVEALHRDGLDQLILVSDTRSR